MLQLQGQVMNVLETPRGTTREGQEYGGVHQVQLLCEEHLRNGEKRMQLHTLRADDVEPFRKLQGRMVAVPVGVFARGGNLYFYLQKQATPKAIQASAEA